MKGREEQGRKMAKKEKEKEKAENRTIDNPLRRLDPHPFLEILYHAVRIKRIRNLPTEIELLPPPTHTLAFPSSPVPFPTQTIPHKQSSLLQKRSRAKEKEKAKRTIPCPFPTSLITTSYFRICSSDPPYFSRTYHACLSSACSGSGASGRSW